jgi:hypothetical protein
MNGNTTQRIGQLQHLHARLSAHHFGLDREIHRLLQAVAPWHLFPGSQARPRVIGLWGMTGTGKSSLVRNLVRELGLEDVTFWLDAGECHSNYWMDHLYQRLEKHMNGKPFVVVVDEFQHAAVRDHTSPEPMAMRQFWEFLDAGRVVTWPNVYRLLWLVDMQERIAMALKAGARVAGGRVVEGREKYQELVLRHYGEMEVKEDMLAIPCSEFDELRDMFPDPQPSLPGIAAMLDELDGTGILGMLQRIRTTAQRPNVVDARQALVLVLGNLDELYTTGKEPLAELHPDVLVHRHKDIGRAGIQNGLLRMFRLEQVSRLGNDHVIFPPMGRTVMETLADHEVASLLERLGASCGISFSMERAVIERIRNSAGAAVMGARPVVQAVQRILPALFTQVLQWPAAQVAKRIELVMEDETPVAVLDEAHRITLHWPMEQVGSRKAPADELERIAVHEAGHALLGRVLCGMRPLQVCVRSQDPQLRGFVVWGNNERAILRREIVPQLARLLGGLLAEKWRTAAMR